MAKKRILGAATVVVLLACVAASAVSSIEKIEAKGELTEITTGKDKKVKSFLVKNQAGERGCYDQANVLIDSKTKIFKGCTDHELQARELSKGAVVEVSFTDEPRMMIYPVSAPAKTIRVMETPENSVVYQNAQYGFSISLPDSWEDYMIVTDRWEGYSLGDGKNNKIVETGPIISIRHPQWTARNPRQDIPIMVFTLTQWGLLQQDKFHIGAAPMGPRELRRNSRYVFALPARYNYAFPTGYEEVERILESNPLKAKRIRRSLIGLKGRGGQAFFVEEVSLCGIIRPGVSDPNRVFYPLT